MATTVIHNEAEAPSQLALFTGEHRRNGRYCLVFSVEEPAPGNTPTPVGASSTYPGGKGHCYQKLINLIPPHRVYIESHAGGGAILRNKRPARLNIALDIDPLVIENLRADHTATIGDAPGKIATTGDAPDNGYRTAKNNGTEEYRFINANAVEWLQSFDFHGDEFIYADPPYLFETRKQKRPLYRFEYTVQDHIDLLSVLTGLDCKIMISGYRSELYADMLTGWHTVSFETRTRGGSWATEVLWMNYPKPTRLHDYRFLGDDYRERERIKRKTQRWATKWANLPQLERQAILAAIEATEGV